MQDTVGHVRCDLDFLLKEDSSLDITTDYERIKDGRSTVIF